MLVLALPFLALASDWGYYGGDPGGTRFSRIDSINVKNGTRLNKVWEYHTGALQPDVIRSEIMGMSISRKTCVCAVAAIIK